MSFLGIRRWNLKGKAKSVSKKTSWVFPTANQLPSPPSTTTSAESFESPLIVEIAPSPSTIPEGLFVSPHIDVRLSHEPFFPANLFTSETSVATSAGHGPESHEWNPYAPTPGKKAEGEKVVAIVSGDADNDEPEAWVDEPTARPNPNTVRRVPSRKNRPAPSPIQIPGTTTPPRPQSTASRRSTRASRGLRSATPYHSHPPVSSPVRGGDDDASVISGITLPGALIGGAFRVAHESEHDREREAPMPARPAGSRRITRIDSATLPRGIDPSLYSPHGASERADSPVDPGVTTRASISAGTGSRASVGAHVPPPLAILGAERSSLRPLRLPSGALELPSHRVSRISEARSSPPSSADLQSISPRRSSDSARSGQRPTSRAISNSILHPDKFVTKSMSRPPTYKESKEPSPSGTDDAFASAFPSASVPIAPSESLPSAAIPVSAAPLESASVPPESASVSIPVTLPTMPETPFSPDPLLDGVLPPFLPDGGDASSAPPSSSFPETSIASAFPETPFGSDRDFSRVSSGPPSRASSISRAHRRRTATAGAATVASPKPRPVSQKQDAAALRQSICRRRRSRARSQGRVVLSVGEELVAPSVPVMPASAVSIVYQTEAAQKVGRVASMLVGPRERVGSKAKHEQTTEPVATTAEKVDVKPLEGRKDGGKDRRREREGGEGRGRQPRFIAGVPPAPLVEPPPPPRLDARSRSCGPSREPSSARSSEVDKDTQMVEVGVRTANIKLGLPPSQTVQVPGDRTRGAPTPAIGSPPKKSPLMTPKSANSSVGVSTLKGSPRVAAVSGAAQADGRPSMEDVTLRPSLGERPRQPADIPPLSPPPSYERMDRPHTSADVAPITTATTFSSPLIPQRPGTSTASSVPMLPSRSVGADSTETVTPPRSGTPEQQQLHGSQVRRSTQVRLQGPMGPRQRTRNTSVSASPHIGPVSSVSITPPAPISEPVVPQPTTPEAAPAITSWPTPRFQEKPVGIRPYTLEAAQWTFSNTEFQGVVSRAIRQSAAPTSIRVLAPKILEEDLPREQERLNALIADLKMNYKLRVRKRNNLLASAGSMADGALRAKLDELRTLNEEMDEITERLYIARDQTAQLQLLVATHDGSALAIALRKLNVSFLKRTQEAQELSERCEQLEAERDEAHAHAMRAAADLDQLNETLGNGTGTGDSSIASSSRRASVSRLSGQRGLRGFRSASRSQRASLASSAAGNRLSRQSIITSRSSVYSPFSPEEPLPPVPKIPPKLSTPALLAAGQSSNTGSAIDSYGSSVPPSSSITGNESARALRDVMNMLGIDHRAIKRRRVSMSSVGSPGLPPLSARSAASFSSPLPILPVSPRPLMHGRSKSASTVDLLQAIRMEEVEREAVLAVLEKGLMNA